MPAPYVTIYIPYDQNNNSGNNDIIELHKRAFRATKDIGLEIQTSNKFRRLNYNYNPHISIIKLNPEDNIDGFIWIDRNYKNIKMANSLQHKIIPELISGGLM